MEAPATIVLCFVLAIVVAYFAGRVITCGLIACLALFPETVSAQNVSGRFLPLPEKYGLHSAKREPTLGSIPPAASETVELGPLSPEELSRRPRPGVRHIGLRRIVPSEAFQHVSSVVTPTGRRVLRLGLHSGDAAAIRVHFTNFAAGFGEVWVYGEGKNPSWRLMDGPYSGQGPLDDGAFWSATIHSGTVIVEFDAPAGSVPPDFPFRIDAISHQWSTADASGALSGPASCELDASCYSEWAKYASGVPLYEFIGADGGAYVCSGVMLNSTGVIPEPYMLTANHCISDNSEAQSIQAYFGYQTAFCGGVAPDLGYVDRVLVGVYLTGATIPKGDYTLVRLSGMPPTGLGSVGSYFFGWSASAPEIGELVTGIHHPQDSWTRIAFGARISDQTLNISGSVAPANLYYQVDFTQGLIEPGSSGSPLLNANAEVVGTATAAPESSAPCDIRPFIATYGRFSDAYPALAPYLNVNPAPAFLVAPSSIAYTKSDGVLSHTQGFTVTTQSLSSVPFSVQASDPWLWLVSESDGDTTAGTLTGTISASAPASVAVRLNDTQMTFNGSYKSSVKVTVGNGVAFVVPVAVTVANTKSNVTVVLTDPVLVDGVPGASGETKWTFVMTLAERAGVATKVTSFKVAGQDRSNEVAELFQTPDILPGESRTVLVQLASTDNASGFLPIEVDGLDPGSGALWSQTMTVPSVQGSALAFTLPAIVNSPGAPDCPFPVRVVIRAMGNASLTKTQAVADGSVLTDQIAQIFGSTYNPAGGTVQGDGCGQSWWLVANMSDHPGPTVLTFGSQPAPAVATRSPLSVNPSSLQLNSSTSTAISVNPGSANLSWSTLVTYSQLPNNWLTVAPIHGTGAGSIQLTVDTSPLIPGSVYSADLLVQSVNSTPQVIDIPITVTVPGAGIAVVNAASFALGTAPGMAVSIFAPGMSLASAEQQAASLPLPANMQGVTVTINNVPAPLYYVSPTQLNAQIPYEVQPGPATLNIQNSAGQVATQQIYVNMVAPGIFLSSDGKHVAPDVPVKAGKTATLFFSGQGYVVPAVATGSAPPDPTQVPVSGLPKAMANVAVNVNGVPAQIIFAGIPYYLTGVAQAIRRISESRSNGGVCSSALETLIAKSELFATGL